MLTFLQSLLESSTLSPHGICLLWRPELIWLNVSSDAIIALSYFSIPFALAIFVSKRPDVEFGWIFWAFAIFITACGMTHVMSIWTLWVPEYGLEGLVKAVTAAASIITAIVLWPLLPKVLALPSPAQLRATQAELENQIAHRLEAEERMRQSQKLEAVGQLTGGVAHDFNNLLTIIVGNLEIAQQNLGSWSKDAEDYVRRAIANAMGGAQRATALTQRLLAFARRQPLAPTPLNVNNLVNGLSEFIRRTLGEDVELEVVGSAGLWQVEADQAELEAALLNLVVNARDAMPTGGKLSIETSNAFLDETYCRDHLDIRSGQYVQIAVTDTGRGMDKETLDRAFEPFFTTKEAGQGTGLGLSQVYGFVKQSNGHVKIYSEPGEGTTVKIYLPRLLRDSAEPKPPAREVPGGHAGETILVVEDDPDVRAYVVEALRQLRYRVLEAKDGPTALAVTGPIDLLLTDVVLPKMNGRQLSDAMKARQANLRVLFMTGYSRNAIVHQGRLDPGVELIQKPLSQATLALRVRAILDAGK
jgi:signal transduction histidine kinase/CheY-like chemotaxis protein